MSSEPNNAFNPEQLTRDLLRSLFQQSSDGISVGAVGIPIYSNSSGQSSRTLESGNSSNISQMFAPADSKGECKHRTCYVAEHFKTINRPTLKDEFIHLYHYRKAKFEELCMKASPAILARCKLNPSDKYSSVFEELGQIRADVELINKLMIVFRLLHTDPKLYVRLFVDFVKSMKSDETSLSFCLDFIIAHINADLKNIVLPEEKFMDSAPLNNVDEYSDLITDLIN